MEDRHRCKLCLKNFGSGRALGGHMRSHMMKLPVVNLKEEEQQPVYDVQSYSSTSEEEGEIKDDDDDDLKSYELEEGDGGSDENSERGGEGLMFPLQDRESETESPRIGSSNRPVCRRSKRVRKSRISDFNGFGINAFFQAKKSKSVAAAAKADELYEKSSVMETEAPLSSISDTTPEEHVAHCLIMLSRDKWARQESDDHQEQEAMMGKSSKRSCRSSSSKKVKGKYRCETCNKLFRSYQALGGHRASHNKVKVNAVPPPPAPDKNGNHEKTHQCPFCHRIFPSGQALGGHKRSHFAIGASSSAATAAVSKSNDARIGEILDIDLNLPPVPTDDEDENSQVDVSAVSDAEFVHTSK